MKSKLLIYSLSLLGLMASAQAQIGYYNDALLFSRTNFNGTARMQGIGGAQVALGGDISSAVSNPAGLGFFNRSVFSFTPSLNFHDAEATYFGQSTAAFKTNFNFNQLGLVINYSKGDILPDKYKGGSFAISLNRINDFHSEEIYEGRNPTSSIVDYFISNAGNLFPNDLPGQTYTAFDQFLIDEADYDSQTDYFIDPDGNGGFLITPNSGDGSIEGYSSLVGAFPGSLPYQRETILTGGAQYQLNFSWGGNYDDRFYFGGGLGVQTLNYSLTKRYQESDYQFTDGTTDDILYGLTLEDRLNVTGAGVNINMGVIVRPLQFMTVGVSFVTPTFYALNEESDYTFSTDWNENYSYVLPNETLQLGFIETESDIFTSDYSLRTPSRLNAGMAFFLGKYGFLTGDIEYVDHSGALLNANEFSMSDDNAAIQDIYTSVLNYRGGLEIRLDNVRVRGGYNYQADPYRLTDGVDRSRRNLTFGVGYRTPDFFIDGALIRTSYSQQYTPYSVPDLQEPIAEVENTSYNATITIGFVF